MKLLVLLLVLAKATALVFETNTIIISTMVTSDSITVNPQIKLTFADAGLTNNGASAAILNQGQTYVMAA